MLFELVKFPLIIFIITSVVLLKNKQMFIYGFFFTNFTNQVIKDNLAILKDDVNNIEAARNIERELLSNNIIIPLYIENEGSLERTYQRYKDEKDELEKELKSIDSGSDRAYDINSRLIDIERVLQGSNKLTYVIRTVG